MKGFSLALLALTALATDHVSAFTPSGLRSVGVRQSKHERLMVVDMSTETDVSVPYDAAARYTYENWCKEFGKDIDESRYTTFKDNYEAITVMNIAAKKKAREEGDENPSLLALNEYADCTAEEYEAAMSGETPASSEGVLGKAMEAAESQMEASSALQDAADALAEEEEVGLLELQDSHYFQIVSGSVGAHFFGNVEIGRKARIGECPSYI